MTPSIPATLIAGDGIGPEIMDATLAARDALAWVGEPCCAPCAPRFSRA